jgi:WD40 repeat protein
VFPLPKVPIFASSQEAILQVLRVLVLITDKYLVCSSKDKTVRLWDLESKTLLHTFRPPISPGFDGFLYAAAISPDASTIATGGVNRKIYLFERENGCLVKVLDQPSGILHLEYSPDGRFLVAALARKQGFVVYEASGYSIIAWGKDAGGSTYYAGWDNHHHIATAPDDGFIRLYNLTKSADKSLQLGPVNSNASYQRLARN